MSAPLVRLLFKGVSETFEIVGDIDMAGIKLDERPRNGGSKLASKSPLKSHVGIRIWNPDIPVLTSCQLQWVGHFLSGNLILYLFAFSTTLAREISNNQEMGISVLISY